MATVRKQWLQLTTEAPLEPTLPICDAHHHLWDRPDDRYLLDELLQDISSGHNIVSTVFIECESMYRKDGPEEMKPIGQTEFVQGIAAQSASGQYGPTSVAAGIVGHANLALGASVAQVLEGHLAASPNRFRGIRHICTWDASPEIVSYAPIRRPGLLLDSSFRAGVACLEQYGLSFDVMVFFPQLSELASLARAIPGVTVILNHAGGVMGVGPYAGKQKQVFEAWKQGITEVAACPNVVVKLGGLGMPRCGFHWDARPAPPTSAELAEATKPYYLTCIEEFGPNRCMFESNVPPDAVSYSYGIVWNSFKLMTQGLSPTERAALFHDTAVRVYRLA